ISAPSITTPSITSQAPALFRVVVEEIPTEASRCSKFVANHITAEDNPHQLASVPTPLGGTQHDVARNLIRVVYELFGKPFVLSVLQPKLQILPPPQHHRPQ